MMKPMNLTRRDFIKTSAAGLAGLMTSPLYGRSNPQEPTKREGVNYAILISKKTLGDTEWKKVADSLREKYQRAEVYSFEKDLEELEKPLGEQQPTHVAYISTPEELRTEKLQMMDPRKLASTLETTAQGQFTTLLRMLNPEGYLGAIGGIITGREAKDALRLAQAKPLTIERGLFKTLGENITYLQEGVSYSDGKTKDGIKRMKRKGTTTIEDFIEQAGEELLEELNSNNIDFFLFNGHANDRQWEAGYGYKDDVHIVNEEGEMRVYRPVFKEGTFKGYTPFGKVNTNNPKAVASWGSCGTARIVDPQSSLALAWINNGAVQYVGHTSLTFFSEGTHGIVTPLFSSNDNPTIAEAVHQALQVTIHNQQEILKLKEKKGIDTETRADVGNKHDLLSFTLYGDPALDCRIKKDGTHKPPLHFERKEKTISLTTTEDVTLQSTQPSIMIPKELRGREIKQATKGLEHNIAGDVLIFNVGATPQLTNRPAPDLIRLEKTPIPKGTTYNIEFE